MNAAGRNFGRSDGSDRRRADVRRRKIRAGRAFFAPLFGSEPVSAAAGTVTLGISEWATSAMLFAFVLIGFAIAWRRYATAGAQHNAVERLRRESVGDAARCWSIDSTLTTSSTFSSCAAPRVSARSSAASSIRACSTVPCATSSSGRAGSARAFRSFQTGLVRAYALVLVFGAACFIAYYAFAGSVR